MQTRHARARALSALLAALLLGCGDAVLLDQSADLRPGAELSTAHSGGGSPPRAVLTLARDEVAVGEPFEIVLVVETPPEHAVEPPPAPEIPGLELLAVSSRVDARPGPRLLHTTSHRLRASVPGAVVWPASQVVVEAPAGERTSLALPERRLEVTSARALFPQDQLPFGLRDLPDPPQTRGFVAGLILGSVAVLLIALPFTRAGRRLRDRLAARGSRLGSQAEPDAVLESGGAAWARAELARARQLLGDDPRAASNVGATALRGYVAVRFRIRIESATTEELASLRPGAATEAVWSEFLRIMQRYDAERFQRRDAGEPWALQVERCLEESERFMAAGAERGARAR